jgi:hypothetical protein
MLVVAVLVILLLLCLSGCKTMRQSVTTVKYSKGCHIEVRTAESEKASEMMEDIRFSDCTMGSNEELDNAKEKPPPE